MKGWLWLTNLYLKGRNRLNSHFPLCLNKNMCYLKRIYIARKIYIMWFNIWSTAKYCVFNMFNQIQGENEFFPLQLCCPSFPLSPLQHATLFSFDSLVLYSPPQKQKTCICKQNTSSFFFLALQPPSGVVYYSPLAGFSFLACEVSWSHTTTRHSR